MQQVIPYDLVESDLFDVQELVEGNLTWQEDIKTFGELEHWATVEGAGFGDCDNHAITKLRRLWERHREYPRAFRLAICAEDFRDGKFIGCHMVLLVFTDRGVYCLDNMYRYPIAIQDVPNRVWCFLEPKKAGERWTYFELPAGREYRVLLPFGGVI